MCGNDTTDGGDESIAGRTIKGTRPMTDDELEREGWTGRGVRPVVLVLDGGVILFPSRDPEGNGPGQLFGIDGEETFALIPGAE